MRGQKGVCLLCRHVFGSRKNIAVTKRLRSTRARGQEPYVLPRLVIDLDAADSDAVRRLEDIEEYDPTPSKDPKAMAWLSDKLERKYSRIVEEEQRFKKPVALKTLSTMPVDLFSYILLGDPMGSAPRKTGNPQFRALFRARMIQPEDSAETKIQQLTVDFTTKEEERLRVSGFGKSDEGAIVEQIRECEVFSKLHRMVSMLSRTREGCQFLATNGSTIMESVRNCRKERDIIRRTEKILPTTVVSMLNNLQLNMESKGVQIGPHLCNGGLKYAAKSNSLPAIRKYLQILRANSYPTNRWTVSALKHLFRRIKSAPKDFHSKEQYRRTESLRVATGWENGTAPRDGEHRWDLSFAYLFSKDDSADFTTCLYPRYIMGLGELGLGDTLWAEWKLEGELHFPALIRGNDHMRFRARMFALAFMIAKDQERALEVLSSVPMDHDDSVPANYNSLTQNWEPNAGGHIMAPNISSGEWLLALIYEHYSFNNVWGTDGLFQMVKNTIKELSKDPVETVSILGRFLVTDLDLDYSKVRNLEWSMRDGGGLLIKRMEDGKPLYWKPDRPISEPPGDAV